DRPLFELSHFKKVVGETVSLKCHLGTDGRRKFKGKLIEISEKLLAIEVDGQVYEVDFLDIDKANLVANF
ncbi:MAG: ribosome maturation factor RimP, partial [Kangiellaceae bacterium]